MRSCETGLYYLQSRYYNPTWGRFINADALVSTGQDILGNNMFAYCLNSPTTRIDSVGTLSYRSGVDELDPLALPWENAGGGGGAVGCVTGSAAGYVIGAGITHGFLSEARKRKPINLPSSKKVALDEKHITSGHMPGGDRNPDGKKSVFWGLTAQQVMKAIYEAYEHSSKLQTQGDRIKLLGVSSTYNLVIEMWINVVTYVIETAYPK